MPDSESPTRRKLLEVLGVSSIGALAGCERVTSGPSGNGTEAGNYTILFRDGSVGTTTHRTTSSSPDQVIDGGDAAAFASALEALADHPGATLEIEPGTYRFETPQGRGGGKWRFFEPPALENVTINGNGATIVLTEPRAGGFLFVGGKGITIRDLTIDNDPPPFTQGRILDISEERRTIRVELDEGYPPLTHEMFESLDQVGGSLHTTEGEFIRGERRRGQLDKYYTDISRIDDRRYEMRLSEYTNFRGLRTGIKQLFKARRISAVFGFYQVEKPLIENVTLHASNAAGFQFGVGDDPTVRDCVIAPPETSDRLIGINADGVRFINVESDPVLEDSRIEYAGDDPIVVQHTLSPISDILDERTVKVEEWHPFVVKPGDVLRALRQDGSRIDSLPPISDVDYRYDNPEERGKPLTVTFEQSIRDTLDVGDILGNTETGSHGFRIRNNAVRNVRGHLVRIAASHGIVEDNTLEGAHRNGIELECETYTNPFSAKGGVTDVTVRNNDITRPGLNYLAGLSPSGIRVHHRPPRGTESRGQPNRDLTITGNSIANGAHVGIEVEQARDVSIEGNEMEDLNQLDYPEQGKYGVILDQVTSATVSNNTVQGTATKLSQFGVRWRSEGIEAENNSLRIDGEDRPARIVSFDPVRFTFNKTVRPEGGHLYLALRCFSMTLMDDQGQSIRVFDMGDREAGFLPGEGLYEPQQREGETWRWLGGQGESATVYLWDDLLAESSSMVMDAEPYAQDITATVSVDGENTDTLSFDSTARQTFKVSLSGSA